MCVRLVHNVIYMIDMWMSLFEPPPSHHLPQIAVGATADSENMHAQTKYISKSSFICGITIVIIILVESPCNYSAALCGCGAVANVVLVKTTIHLQSKIQILRCLLMYFSYRSIQ